MSQEQLNQLFYGSKFVKLDYTIGNYNSEYSTFWKSAQKKISKSKAGKMKNDAERKYLQNPLNKDLLDNMVNIYSVLNENQKLDLCSYQKNLLIQTVEKSGDGKNEETAICVIAPDEVLGYLKKLIQSGPRAEFNQKMKHLPDGSILTIYKIGERQMVVTSPRQARQFKTRDFWWQIQIKNVICYYEKIKIHRGSNRLCTPAVRGRSAG